MTQPQEHSAQFIEELYDKMIGYYWKASKNNKRYYKLTRAFTVILGAGVTLVSSLSSSTFFNDSPFWATSFALATPFSAAVLAIIGGFSQTFQWGAAWQDMVMTATHLEKERTRFMVTPPAERDLQKEAEILHDFVLEESRGFFERLLGSSKPPGLKRKG